MQPYPPLQTLIAAAMLRDQGYSVVLHDVTLSESPELEFRAAIEKHQPRLVAVIEDNFNFLTKMCLTRNRELAFRMGAAARDAGIPAVVNGSDSSDRPNAYLNDGGFDMALVGEVETTLGQVAKLIVRGEGTREEIRGLAYAEAGRIFRTGAALPITDLDRLPDAAWDLVDMDAYRKAWTKAHGYFSLNLVSSRGCPYRCNWCAKPVFGSSYHFRSPDRVAQEMFRLKRDYRADHIWFADDIFALSPQWTRAFAESVERRDAAVEFKMQSRCDLMTRDTVGALRRADARRCGWRGIRLAENPRRDG